MDKEWIYLNNPFFNATTDNFSKFISIINFSNDRFLTKAGDTFFDTIIAIVQPACDGANSAYAQWTGSQAEHVSSTNTVNVLLKKLGSEDIQDFQRRIAVVYAPGSSDYIRLLPHGNAPFQSGTQANRLLALSNLITAIGSDASLASVKTSAQSVLTALTTAKSEQTADLSQTDLLSDAMELVRISACNVLWKSFGLMIAQFVETPSVIGNYYDLENLRSHEQVSFTHLLHPLSSTDIVKRKLTDTMQVRIRNNSNAEVRVWYAAEKNDEIGSTYVTVAANSDVTADATSLGDLTLGHFIKVKNMSTLVDARFTLSILK